MSLVNRLIREAAHGARELAIRPQDVGPVAAHIRATTHILAFVPHETRDLQVRSWLKSGDVELRGVPIRVIGA